MMKVAILTTQAAIVSLVLGSLGSFRAQGINKKENQKPIELDFEQIRRENVANSNEMEGEWEYVYSSEEHYLGAEKLQEVVRTIRNERHYGLLPLRTYLAQWEKYYRSNPREQKSGRTTSTQVEKVNFQNEKGFYYEILVKGGYEEGGVTLRSLSTPKLSIYRQIGHDPYVNYSFTVNNGEPGKHLNIPLFSMLQEFFNLVGFFEEVSVRVKNKSVWKIPREALEKKVGVGISLPPMLDHMVLAVTALGKSSTRKFHFSWFDRKGRPCKEMFFWMKRKRPFRIEERKFYPGTTFPEVIVKATAIQWTKKAKNFPDFLDFALTPVEAKSCLDLRFGKSFFFDPRKGLPNLDGKKGNSSLPSGPAFLAKNIRSNVDGDEGGHEEASDKKNGKGENRNKRVRNETKNKHGSEGEKTSYFSPSILSVVFSISLFFLGIILGKRMK